MGVHNLSIVNRITTKIPEPIINNLIKQQDRWHMTYEREPVRDPINELGHLIGHIRICGGSPYGVNRS